ncbi:unnamed protein product [Rhizophagus irregularis]|nr:unnamed protein product [Rhizophagus irregularis]
MIHQNILGEHPLLMRMDQKYKLQNLNFNLIFVNYKEESCCNRCRSISTRKYYCWMMMDYLDIILNHLVKQYQFKKHPEFALIDIIATFNSIVNWHFPSDSDIPIQPKQFDMLYIVLHKLMHGLGFTSNWQNWFLTGNKNQILITSKPDVVISDNEVIFDEFKETSFDRHLIFNSNYKNLYPVTVKLNDFANPVVIAENMNNISTTFNSLSSYPKSCYTERAILETTLIPFQNGQSIFSF